MMGEEGQGALRLFVALLAPAGVRAAVAAAQAGLRAQELAVRWIDPADAHITLQFLGATPRDHVPALSAALAEVAARGRPLALRTAGLGVFPDIGRARVVWLGLTGEVARLAAIQAEVLAATGRLGFVAEARPFAPHLTLGRLRNEVTRDERARAGRATMTAAPPPPVDWRVDDLALMMSILGRSGATYQAVGRWRLGTGEALGITMGQQPQA